MFVLSRLNVDSLALYLLHFHKTDGDKVLYLTLRYWVNKTKHSRSGSNIIDRGIKFLSYREVIKNNYTFVS